MSDQPPLIKFKRKAYRDGYLQTQVRSGIAYQVQALREKSDLNQTDFAKEIGKPQSVVSRLEDTEYGRVSVQTLLDIACARNVALVVKFVSYPEFLAQTQDMSIAALQPATIYESIRDAENVRQIGIPAHPVQHTGAGIFIFYPFEFATKGKRVMDEGDLRTAPASAKTARPPAISSRSVPILAN